MEIKVILQEEQLLKDMNLEEIEYRIKKCVEEAGCKLFKKILEKKDKEILKEKEKREFKVIGKRKKSIKTIFGVVEYKRRVYRCNKEEGKKYRFLLDETMEEEIGDISPLIREKIIRESLRVSFREVSKNIEKDTGITLSHQGVWNVVQKHSEKLKEEEDRSILEIEGEHKKKDKKKQEVIFQEVEGIWINVKGGKKKELKLGIIYEGWEKRNRNKNNNEYIVKNKKVYSSFNTKRFFKLNDAIIAKNYDIDFLKLNIMNGDGANWIKGGIYSNVIYQIDRFHINQGIVRGYKGLNKKTKKLMKMINDKKVEDVIEIVKKDLTKNKNDKYLSNLYTYLKNNRKYILRYNERGLDIPKPPVSVYYRNLGTMEHNICDILAQRMKNNKTSWSIAGAENMARLLSQKHSHAECF